MPKIFVAILFFALLLSGCDKFKSPRKWKVNYQVEKKAPGAVQFRVSYRTSSGGTKQEGLFSDAIWTSDTIFDFEEGKEVWLEVEVISGNVPLELRILRDTAPHEWATMPAGTKKMAIEDVL